MARYHKTNTPPIPEEFKQSYKNKYVCLYAQHADAYLQLSDEGLGKLVKAIINYTATATEPTDLPPTESIIFTMLKPKMDEDFQKGMDRRWQATYAQSQRRIQKERALTDDERAFNGRSTSKHLNTETSKQLNNETTEHLNNETQSPQSIDFGDARGDSTDVDKYFLFILNDRKALQDFHNSDSPKNYNGVVAWIADEYYQQEKGTNEIEEIGKDYFAQKHISGYKKIPNSELSREILANYCADKDYGLDPDYIWQHLPDSFAKHWTAWVDGCERNRIRESEEF